MRNLILSSILALGFVTLCASAWQANAAAIIKGPAPAIASQAEPVRCWINAPRDGCGFGWYRSRSGRCRPC